MATMRSPVPSKLAVVVTIGARGLFVREFGSRNKGSIIVDCPEVPTGLAATNREPVDRCEECS